MYDLKHQFAHRLWLLCSVVAVSACVAGYGSKELDQNGSEWLPQQAISGFRFFRVGDVTDSTMTAVASALGTAAPQIQQKLKVSRHTYQRDAMFVRPVKVVLWHSQAEFAQSFDGEVPGIPGNFAGGYVRVLPNVREIHAFDQGTATPQVVVHEFAHVATLAIQPNLAHKPTWLWEGSAQYLVDEKTEPERLGCLTNNKAPSLAEIHDFPGSMIYNDVSYYLVAFIVQSNGMDKLLELIKENGNTEKVLGVSEQQMHQSWIDWMRSNYDLNDLPAMNERELTRHLTNNTFDLRRSGLSSFQRADGTMLVGTDGAVSRIGTWSVGADGKVLIELSGEPRRSSTWYHVAEDRYLVLSEGFCRLVEYRRRLGNAAGFESVSH